MQTLWRPAILKTFTLIITGLAIWTRKLLKVDLITTILGDALRGINGISLVYSEYGLGAAVATLHPVKLVTVLFVLPWVVKILSLIGILKY